jgi:hypothetical protein
MKVKRIRKHLMGAEEPSIALSSLLDLAVSISFQQRVEGSNRTTDTPCGLGFSDRRLIYAGFVATMFGLRLSLRLDPNDFPFLLSIRDQKSRAIWKIFAGLDVS